MNANRVFPTAHSLWEQPLGTAPVALSLPPPYGG